MIFFHILNEQINILCQGLGPCLQRLAAAAAGGIGSWAVLERKTSHVDLHRLVIDLTILTILDYRLEIDTDWWLPQSVGDWSDFDKILTKKPRHNRPTAKAAFVALWHLATEEQRSFATRSRWLHQKNAPSEPKTIQKPTTWTAKTHILVTPTLPLFRLFFFWDTLRLQVSCDAQGQLTRRQLRDPRVSECTDGYNVAT